MLSTAILALVWDGTPKSSSADGEASNALCHKSRVFLYLVMLFAATATIIIDANLLQIRDNPTKNVGLAATVVVLISTELILFPATQADILASSTIFGAGMVAVTAWTYNHFRQTPSVNVSYSLLPQVASEDGQSEPQPEKAENKNNNTIWTLPTPTTEKVFGAFGVVSVLAILASLFHSSTHLPVSKTYTKDIKRFFNPNNIEPAVWGETENPIHCIEEFVKREDIHLKSSKLIDWEIVHPRKSECPVYPVPDGGIYFHVYWRGDWRPFNALVIEAWLATQRLVDGHKLIYWYEDSQPYSQDLERFATGEYGKYVEFRALDRLKEAEGTCMAEMREWIDAEYQKEINLGVTTQSDLLRNLLLSKYGGIWIDADTLPMRDLTPLIRSGPAACGVSSRLHPHIFTDLADIALAQLQSDQWNTNLFVMGPPSAIGRKVIETTCRLPFDEALYNQTEFGMVIKPNMHYWLYVDAMLKHCALPEINCGINRQPIAFTDGQYFAGPRQEFVKPCDNGTVEEFGRVPDGLRGLWTYHSRIGHHGDECMLEGSGTVAVAIRKRIGEMLELGLDTRGRSIYPGVGWVS